MYIFKKAEIVQFSRQKSTLESAVADLPILVSFKHSVSLATTVLLIYRKLDLWHIIKACIIVLWVGLGVVLVTVLYSPIT